MGRSRAAPETSVGLFAFLDVLMSTMGSLILVLIIVTPKIRQEVVAKAAAEARRTAEKEVRVAASPTVVPSLVAVRPRKTIDRNLALKVELAELSRQTESRERVADEKRQELETARQKLKEDKNELHDLERRLARVQDEKARVAEGVTKVSGEAIEVESRLASTGARLRAIRGQIAHASTRYSFVAYDGVSGTTRHPILIECTREHIKFLQENISLSAADVSGFTPSFNPVRAGTQALIDYWATHAAPGEPRPYVLIVVRPSGTLPYYLLRNLLEGMNDRFGYELLSDDQVLEVPPPVPEAAEECRKAVQKAMAERVEVFNDTFGGRGSGRHPKSGQQPGAPGVGPGRTVGTVAQSGRGASPFDDLGGDETGRPAADGSGGTARGHQVGIQPGGLASANATGAAGGPSSPGNDKPGDGAGGSGLPGSGTGNSPAASKEKTSGKGIPTPGSGDFGGGTDGSAAAGLITNASPTGQSGSFGGRGAQAGEPTAGSSSLQSGSPGGRSDFPPSIIPRMGNGGDPSIAGMDPDRLTIGRPTGGGGGGGGDGQSGSDTGDDPLTGASGRPGGFPGSAGEAGGSKFGESLGGLAGSAPAQLEPPDFGSPQVGAEGGSNAGLQNGSPSPGSAGFSSGSDLPSSTGDDGQAGSSGGSAGSPATDGLPNFSAGVESDGRPNKPSRESAHRWGISSPRASIGFERDVTVYIEAQRIFVVGQPPIPCGRGETSQQLSRAFLRSLDRDARSWGRPPDSFYWVPNLKFEISPGGLVHHERLQNALQRHALTSSVDYRLELSRPAPMPSLVE